MVAKVLILGASGMLGNAAFRVFSGDKKFEVVGTVRTPGLKNLFPKELISRLAVIPDIESMDDLVNLFNSYQPEVVINCIGLVKQLSESNAPLSAIPINSLLPHRLASICSLVGARLIHMSTDCVFSGTRGQYVETDFPDANDLYGRSKYLGEVDYQNAITLRTSIIGHEIAGHRSLIGWFLAQEERVMGYKNAIFSGLPTVEVSRVIKDFVIPHENIHGVYHLSAGPINKFDLLTLVAREYGKDIKIDSNEDFKIDRSLNSTRFQKVTGYKPESWPELIKKMHKFHCEGVKNV